MILHIDMDAFYASIEIRDNPRLADQPVVIGSPHGRGVVLTANYIARRFGIHSAMPAAQASRLCPQATFVRPRMQVYAGVAKQIREIFLSYTELVEPLSLDEAFLDVSGSQALFGEALTIARKIKQQIQQQVGLTASAGVAPNKFLAKVASDLEKPDGLVFVDPQRVSEFLQPLSINRVWGIGPRTAKKLQRMGIATVGQLQQLDLKTLTSIFGVNGEQFYRLSRGSDGRAVVPDREAKSVSHETTFRADISDVDVLRAWVLGLCDDVSRRLRRYELVGRKVHLKYRFPDFQTLTRSHTLPEPTDATEVLADAVDQVFQENCERFHRGLRLIGVGVSELRRRTSQQLLLFDQAEVEKRARVDRTADAICEKFGKAALTRASRIVNDPE